MSKVKLEQEFIYCLPNSRFELNQMEQWKLQRQGFEIWSGQKIVGDLAKSTAALPL